MEQLAEFAGNHLLMVLALIGSFGLVATYELRLRATGVTQVSPGDAVKLINKAAVIVDVRSAESFASGHIANARNIPLAELENDPDKIKKNKSKIVLTVCDAGPDAGRAANALRKAGYEHAFSLRGGIKAWRTENLPLATG
jgi:rhodanese-related sulfurtransferase